MMKKAFTLVELAIVIVIIGLLVSGVLVGRELITQARIKAQITQLRDYETSTKVFQSKYNCLPGDCNKASMFFPGFTNGNGNGELENNINDSYDLGGLWGSSPEYYNFFAELSTAKLIKGFYGPNSIIGAGGLPELAIKQGASFFAGSSINFITAGGSRQTNINSLRTGRNSFFIIACNLPNVATNNGMGAWDDYCGIFTAEEASQIDTKIDDGSPTSGNFFGFGGYVSNNDCLAGGQYKTINTATYCQAIYVFDR